MRPLELRLASRIAKQENGCWLWTAGKTKAGYGRICVNGKDTYAHRLMYERAKGKIPEGFEPDHLCRNPACVNPDHLEAVPHRTNMLRGQSFVSLNASKTHCPRGHPYSGENLYIGPKGDRRCRICVRESHLRADAKKRAQGFTRNNGKWVLRIREGAA